MIVKDLQPLFVVELEGFKNSKIYLFILKYRYRYPCIYLVSDDTSSCSIVQPWSVKPLWSNRTRDL